MKTLNLEQMGVQEMDAVEVNGTDAGCYNPYYDDSPDYEMSYWDIVMGLCGVE